MKKTKKISSILLIVGLITCTSASAHIPVSLESGKSAKLVLECFLQEGQAELIMQSSDGTFVSVATTRIYTGDFSQGQKTSEGDMRTPIGVYPMDKAMVYNGAPAVSVGYPTQQQAIMGYTGGDILVHIGRSSRGCISTTDNNFLRLLNQTVFLCSNAEIRIFPAHMTDKNTEYLRFLFPQENFDDLKNVYRKFEAIRTLKQQETTVAISFFTSSFAKNYHYANDSNHSGYLLDSQVRDACKQFLFPDSVKVNSLSWWDTRTGNTRNAMFAFACNQKNVFFDSITICKQGVVVVSIKKTKDGFVVTAHTTLESLVLKKNIEDYLLQGSADSSYVLHTSREKKIIEEVKNPRFFNGVIVDGTSNSELLITMNNRVYLRAAGEKGLFVPILIN